MKCVILQPSYIPWRGYFHQIAKSDIFVFYDDVQYDKHGWRNRNKVKTSRGTEWLTVPVRAKGVLSRETPINQIVIDSSQRWNAKHLSTIRHVYAKAPYYPYYEEMIENLYVDPPGLLADFVIGVTLTIARELGINRTRYIRSSSLGITGRRTERLLAILSAVGATHYVSGPSAREYLDESLLASAGITLEYMRYEYPDYPQLYPPFDPHVSILDLMVTVGPSCGDFIWGAGGLTNDAR